MKTHTHMPEMSVAEYRRRADRNGMVTDHDPVAAAALDAFLGGSGEIRPAVSKPTALHAKGKRSSADQSARAVGGRIGEDIAGDLHAVCRAKGVADMTKIATPMRIHKPLDDGMFIASFAKKAGVDYRGHLLDGAGPGNSGRAVYAETKSVADANDKFYLRHMRKDQVVQLDAAVHARCVAVLIVVRAGRAYAMPWSFARQHVGLGDAELEQWYVRPGAAYLADARIISSSPCPASP